MVMWLSLETFLTYLPTLPQPPPSPPIPPSHRHLHPCLSLASSLHVPTTPQRFHPYLNPCLNIAFRPLFAPAIHTSGPFCFIPTFQLLPHSFFTPSSLPSSSSHHPLISTCTLGLTPFPFLPHPCLPRTLYLVPAFHPCLSLCLLSNPFPCLHYLPHLFIASLTLFFASHLYTPVSQTTTPCLTLSFHPIPCLTLVFHPCHHPCIPSPRTPLQWSPSALPSLALLLIIPKSGVQESSHRPFVCVPIGATQPRRPLYTKPKTPHHHHDYYQHRHDYLRRPVR